MLFLVLQKIAAISVTIYVFWHYAAFTNVMDYGIGNARIIRSIVIFLVLILFAEKITKWRFVNVMIAVVGWGGLILHVYIIFYSL